jgi:hypothetical protein
MMRWLMEKVANCDSLTNRQPVQVKKPRDHLGSHRVA